MAAALALAGCQTQRLTVPAPSFAPPVVRADTVRLPSAEAATAVDTTPTPQQKKQAAIEEVTPDRLINSSALKPQVRAPAVEIRHRASQRHGLRLSRAC